MTRKETEGIKPGKPKVTGMNSPLQSGITYTLFFNLNSTTILQTDVKFSLLVKPIAHSILMVDPHAM